MENASKAIIIAGGILISLILISILLFSFNNTSRLVGMQDNDAVSKEILAFNKRF